MGDLRSSGMDDMAGVGAGYNGERALVICTDVGGTVREEACDE